LGSDRAHNPQVEGCTEPRGGQRCRQSQGGATCWIILREKPAGPRQTGAACGLQPGGRPARRRTVAQYAADLERAGWSKCRRSLREGLEELFTVMPWACRRVAALPGTTNLLMGPFRYPWQTAARDHLAEWRHAARWVRRRWWRPRSISRRSRGIISCGCLKPTSGTMPDGIVHGCTHQCCA